MFNEFNLPKQYSLQLFTNNGESNEAGVMAMICNNQSSETFHLINSVEDLAKFHGAKGTTYANRTLVPNFKSLLSDIEAKPTHYATNAKQMLWVVYANDNFSVLLFKDSANRKKWHKIIQPLFVKLGTAPYYTSTFKKSHEGCSTVSAAQAKANVKQVGFSKDEKLEALTNLMNSMNMTAEEVISLLGGQVESKEPVQEASVSLSELDSMMEAANDNSVDMDCEECDQESDAFEASQCIDKAKIMIVKKYSYHNTYNTAQQVSERFDALRADIDNDCKFVKMLKDTNGSKFVRIDEYLNEVRKSA